MKEVVNEYISKNGKRIQLKESDDRYSLGVISPYDLTEYPYAVRLKNKNVWKIYEHKNLPLNYVAKNYSETISLFGEYDDKDFDYMLESYMTLVDTYTSRIDRS